MTHHDIARLIWQTIRHVLERLIIHLIQLLLPYIDFCEHVIKSCIGSTKRMTAIFAAISPGADRVLLESVTTYLPFDVLPSLNDKYVVIETFCFQPCFHQLLSITYPKSGNF